MLELDADRPAAPTTDASTLVVVRPGPEGGVEVFCVERKKGGFLGGAIVFPGGKLEPDDLDASWIERSTPPRPAGGSFAGDASLRRGLAIAACREALEEAALLPVDGPAPSHADLLAWRAELAAGGSSMAPLLESRGLKIDLGALHPLARWITPVSEPRRFDTRFYLWVSTGSTGEHDGREVTASFWASPAELLERFTAGTVQLAPPTHRVLSTLAAARSVDDAVAVAEEACLDPICPKLFSLKEGDAQTFALALPGDPEHEVKTPRCPGPSRFVLRGGRFVPEVLPA